MGPRERLHIKKPRKFDGVLLKIVSHCNYFSAKQKLKGAVVSGFFCCRCRGEASCSDALAVHKEIMVVDREGWAGVMPGALPPSAHGMILSVSLAVSSEAGLDPS